MAAGRTHDDRFADHAANGGGGRIEAYRALRQIELPAEPGRRETLLEEESVGERSGVEIHQIERRAASGREEHSVRLRNTAIRNFQQHRTARSRRIARTHDNKVAGKFDPAFGVSRSKRDIGDAAIGGARGIDRKMDAALQTFISSGLAEGPAAQPGLDARDFHARHFGLKGQDQQEENRDPHLATWYWKMPSNGVFSCGDLRFIIPRVCAAVTIRRIQHHLRIDTLDEELTRFLHPKVRACINDQTREFFESDQLKPEGLTPNHRITKLAPWTQPTPLQSPRRRFALSCSSQL